MLVMVIETRDTDFFYRAFFVRDSSRKTFHEGGTDRRATYQDIWRLAPRDELVIERDNSTIFIGQTLRFLYGVTPGYHTVIVTLKTSRSITGLIECGNCRGKTGTFELCKIVQCQEVFGSSLLHGFLKKTRALD